MTTKTLIYWIVGIAIATTGAYVIISPIAQQRLDNLFNEGKEEVQEVLSATTTDIDETEVKDAEKTETKVEPKKTTETSSVSTPKPTTSTPVEQPATSGYTGAQVALHNSESSCWSIIGGAVYDLTPYIKKHPGGARNILKICGKDGTSAFEGQHGGESKPEAILANYKLGNLN